MPIIIDTDPTFVPVPTNLTVSSLQSNSLTLSWDEDLSIQEYRILQDLNVISGITSNSYTLTGLTPSTNYTFTVSAKLGGEWSSPSSPVNITTPASGTPSSGDTGPEDPINDPVDKLGSFIFMTEYTVPSGNSGEVVLKYRIGKMSTGLMPEVYTKTVDKNELISSFGLPEDFSGTKTYNPKEYGL